MTTPLAAALALAALLLAGCASGGGPAAAPADEEPGCTAVRGVVVDEAIRPVAGALVEWPDANASATTDERGAFDVPCLSEGTHVVRASHPLYNAVQQAVTVGGSEPPLVKIQLTRTVFAEPYSQVQKFDGFLVCSVGFFLYASEECGEGAGVPCEVPVLGCQRVGGSDANHAQWDFRLDGPFVRSLVVEMSWRSTSPTLSEFQLNVGNDWTCDPFCNGNPLNVTGGPSPLYATVDFDGLELQDRAGNDVALTAETRFSTFVWANWGSGDPQQLNVAVNQPYQVFATAFYHLPAPEGFSFLAGDVPPF